MSYKSLSNLQSAEGSRKGRIRAGRGDGARRGNYSGRGCKGQKARSKVHPTFEGGQLPLVKKLPMMRGGHNRFGTVYQPVNIASIEALKDESVITPELLVKLRLARKSNVPIKILGNSAMTRKVEIHAQAFSKSALSSVEAADGKCVVVKR